MGYVAIGKQNEAGLRDVAFAWRGTIAHSEWHMDVQDKQVEYDAVWHAPKSHSILPRREPSRPFGPERAPGVFLAQGFHKMYTFSGGNTSPQVTHLCCLTGSLQLLQCNVHDACY